MSKCLERGIKLGRPGGDAEVFLEKDRKRNQVDAEKCVGKGSQSIFFNEKKHETPQQHEEKEDDQPVAEEVVEESISEDDPYE